MIGWYDGSELPHNHLTRIKPVVNNGRNSTGDQQISEASTVGCNQSWYLIPASGTSVPHFSAHSGTQQAPNKKAMGKRPMAHLNTYFCCLSFRKRHQFLMIVILFLFLLGWKKCFFLVNNFGLAGSEPWTLSTYYELEQERRWSINLAIQFVTFLGC